MWFYTSISTYSSGSEKQSRTILAEISMVMGFHLSQSSDKHQAAIFPHEQCEVQKNKAKIESFVHKRKGGQWVAKKYEMLKKPLWVNRGTIWRGAGNHAKSIQEDVQLQRIEGVFKMTYKAIMRGRMANIVKNFVIEDLIEVINERERDTIAMPSVVGQKADLIDRQDQPDIFIVVLSLKSKQRPTKRRTPSRSPYSAHDESIQDKELADSQKEGSPDNAEVKQSSSTSRLSLGTQEFSQNDAIEDEVVRDYIDVDTTTTTTIFKDEKQARTMKNPKGISRTTQFSVEKVDNGEDPKAARSRNHHKSDRHREWDSNSAYHPKSEGFRRRNGRESEGAWQDEDLYLHAERTRDENIWKCERVKERMSKHAHKVREYERSDKDRHYSKKEYLIFQEIFHSRMK
nr:hypothetical protein [Tanacetum cinerariifolium]